MKKAAITALLLSLAVLGTWEYYARSKGYIASIDDDKALWAVRRAKLDGLSSKDIVVLGSSRAHFDLQLDQWEGETGVRPLMLACDGSTPTPVFQDIVNNSDFNGTVLIGVTPGLFFSKPSEKSSPWRRSKTRIDFYLDRTYAQRLNHILSAPLKKTFAFLNASEESWDDDIDLKSLINRIHIGNRLGPPDPPFYRFQVVDNERNVTMLDKVEDDTAFAATIQRVWTFFGKNAPPPVKDTILDIYKDLIAKFKARGGRVVFVRFPSAGGFRKAENKVLPREHYWDVLLEQTGCPGYHFEDYPQLSKYFPPEWSHLYTPDAKTFTRDLAAIMLQDGAITKIR